MVTSNDGFPYRKPQDQKLTFPPGSNKSNLYKSYSCSCAKPNRERNRFVNFNLPTCPPTHKFIHVEAWWPDTNSKGNNDASVSKDFFFYRFLTLSYGFFDFFLNQNYSV